MKESTPIDAGVTGRKKKIWEPGDIIQSGRMVCSGKRL